MWESQAPVADLARKLNLSGVVKIEVTIGSGGKAKRTHIVGGNPVLATEADRAAMQSEFDLVLKKPPRSSNSSLALSKSLR
jgi:outer membrane biosynthesis protein TonB